MLRTKFPSKKTKRNSNMKTGLPEKYSLDVIFNLKKHNIMTTRSYVFKRPFDFEVRLSPFSLISEYDQIVEGI